MAEEEKEVKKEEATKEQEPSKEGKSVEVPKKFAKLVEEIEQMSVIDLSELVKVLEEKFGVSAAAPAVVAPQAGAASEGEGAAEEKSAFTIELKDAGSNKIGVIKAIREFTDLGLKEAKDLTEGAPKSVKENVPKEEAEEAKKKLEEAGATVELK